MPVNPTEVEHRFLAAVKHHLDGWRIKVTEDFSIRSYKEELKLLRNDPVYSEFALDSPEYVLTRLVGRMSISIGRRLGEIYDKIPRFVASARFGITPKQVAKKFDGLELDICLRYLDVSDEDQQHLKGTIKALGADPDQFKGIGIEIRYNFNPNDAARLAKDRKMAAKLKTAKLFPVYLIYSTSSPRNEAIRSLKRAGWTFLQGKDASDFTTRLFAIDFRALMKKKKIWGEVKAEVREIMRGIFESKAFEQIKKNA
jgi:hypothetical protein